MNSSHSGGTSEVLPACVGAAEVSQEERDAPALTGPFLGSPPQRPPRGCAFKDLKLTKGCIPLSASEEDGLLAVALLLTASVRTPALRQWPLCSAPSFGTNAHFF